MGALVLVGPLAAIVFLLAVLAVVAFALVGYERTSFLLVAAAVGLVAFNAVRPVASATVSDVFFVLATILVVAWSLAADRPIQNLPSWLWTSAGIFFLAAVLVEIFPAPPSQAALFFPGGAFNHQPGEEVNVYSNLSALLRLEIALLLIPFVLVQVGTSWDKIQGLSEVWLVGTTIAAALGVAAYVGILHLPSLVGGNPEAGAARIRGLSTHPNVFGVTAAMVLPVAAICYSLAQSRRRKISYLLALGILLLAILTSGSRAAILGALLGLALLALLDPAARVALRRSALAAAVVIGLVGLTTFRSLPGVDRLSGSGGVAQSDEVRKAIYSRVISEIEERPLVGHGFEYLRGSHNIYLQVLHSGGVIALAAMLTLVVGVVVTGLRVAARSRRPLVRALLVSALVWLGVDGMFEPAIFDRYLYVPIGLLLACWAVSRKEVPDETPRIGPPRSLGNRERA